jgi:hypothetical protein
MSNKNVSNLANMLGKMRIATGVRRATAKNKNRHYLKNVTARRNTQRKGVKTYSRANAATARRRKAAATAKAARSAAKKEKRNANKAAEREKVIIQGRTRSHQKELSKNQEMK